MLLRHDTPKSLLTPNVSSISHWYSITIWLGSALALRNSARSAAWVDFCIMSALHASQKLQISSRDILPLLRGFFGFASLIAWRYAALQLMAKSLSPSVRSSSSGNLCMMVLRFWQPKSLSIPMVGKTALCMSTRILFSCATPLAPPFASFFRRCRTGSDVSITSFFSKNSSISSRVSSPSVRPPCSSSTLSVAKASIGSSSPASSAASSAAASR
mmetsp:Transcript_86063/g.243099  ORF Transcript_86063/g.243099 Transcript_86063/m.243099 type:complete len:215 (+) Transcript_86063:752-1396(+)